MKPSNTRWFSPTQKLFFLRDLFLQVREYDTFDSARLCQNLAINSPFMSFKEKSVEEWKFHPFIHPHTNVPSQAPTITYFAPYCTMLLKANQISIHLTTRAPQKSLQMANYAYTFGILSSFFPYFCPHSPFFKSKSFEHVSAAGFKSGN